MFYRYLLATEDNKQVLFLYLRDNLELNSDNPSNYKQKNIYLKTYDYIKDNNIDFKGNKVNFVRNGNVLGYIDLSDYDFNHNTYVEIIKFDDINKLIDFELSNNINKKFKLDKYIFGVVSGEMPAIFNEEALKAQAVIARTYALKRLSRNLPISNINTTQLYRDKNYLKNIWGKNYNQYKSKVLKAVKDTNNEVIMYDGDYIDAYYHLTSNGKTEDASNVLKLSYPYLVSVKSDDENINNIDYKVIPNDYLSKLLDTKIDKNTTVDIIIRTIGHRVKYIKFNDKVFDGLILSKRLGLNSNDFKVDVHDRYTTFTTYGCGSGIGLSKYGAQSMAEQGYTYKQILEHYYPKTYIEDLDN